MLLVLKFRFIYPSANCEYHGIFCMPVVLNEKWEVKLIKKSVAILQYYTVINDLIRYTFTWKTTMDRIVFTTCSAGRSWPSSRTCWLVGSATQRRQRGHVYNLLPLTHNVDEEEIVSHYTRTAVTASRTASSHQYQQLLCCPVQQCCRRVLLKQHRELPSIYVNVWTVFIK